MNRIELNAILERLDPEGEMQININGQDIMNIFIDDPIVHKNGMYTELFLRNTTEGGVIDDIVGGIIDPENKRIEIVTAEIADLIEEFHPELFPVMVNSDDPIIRAAVTEKIDIWRQEATL